MESNKNNHIDKLIREGVEASELYYAAEAEEAKSSIWDAIAQGQKEEEAIGAPSVSIWPTVARFAAAAAVALMVVFSAVYLTVQHKETEIAELKLQMEELKKSAASKDSQLHEQQNAMAQANKDQRSGAENVHTMRDTIYITQVKEVYKIMEKEEVVAESPHQLVAVVQPIVPDILVDLPPLNEKEDLSARKLFVYNALPTADQPNKDRKNQRGIKFKIAHPFESEGESKILSFNIKL